MTSPWVRASVIAAATLVALALVEVGARVYLRIHPVTHLAQLAFRATRPAPYHDADYFSPEFLQESEVSMLGTPLETFRLDDVRGRYFNVRDGYRVTTDGPSAGTQRVLLFGGSTLFGQEVPDHLTIASHLQRLLNDVASGRWTVMNFGLPSVTVVQQLALLKRVVLRQGDVVIFYDGVNEVYYPIFFGYRGGIPNHDIDSFRPVERLSFYNRALVRLRHGCARCERSAAARLLFDTTEHAVPQTVVDEEELAANTGLAQQDFAAALQEASALARRAGARFVHFLQPHLFESSEPTPYERDLLESPLLTPPGLGTAFRLGYPALRDAIARSEGMYESHDISGALVDRPNGREVYLDFCHVNHDANAIIAGLMRRLAFGVV